ncbi:hypothetical protein [Sulfitobacter pacificus]|uniref:hypothetical protein n=1 Tax=Sulfitobacter pacificus TaxID=1499314 RepID=UPI0024E1729E|nr:hypothetical protein [Sulfitobacter pacificus]
MDESLRDAWLKFRFAGQLKQSFNLKINALTEQGSIRQVVGAEDDATTYGG